MTAFTNEIHSLLVSVLNVPNSLDNQPQRQLCHELLFTFHNHQLTLNRLDLRFLPKSTALDKLTKRLIELVLEGQRQLCITVANEQKSSLRLEILGFLRQKLKSTVKIFNDGKLDGVILIQLSNSPQLLASLSRHNLQNKTLSNKTAGNNSHNSKSQQAESITTVMQSIVQLSPESPSHVEQECDEQLIEWSIEPSSGDWLVRVLPSCFENVEQKNLRTFTLVIELLKPFILGALGGYCNHVRLSISANDETVAGTTLGTQLLAWLTATSLQFDQDSPQPGVILIHNLSDSLRKVQHKERQLKITSQKDNTESEESQDSSAILEQLLHILDVDGYDFEPIEHDDQLHRVASISGTKTNGHQAQAIQFNGSTVPASKSEEIGAYFGMDDQNANIEQDLAPKPPIITQCNGTQTETLATASSKHTQTVFESPSVQIQTTPETEHSLPVTVTHADATVVKPINQSVNHQNTQTDCSTWHQVEWRFENMQHGFLIVFVILALTGLILAYALNSLRRLLFD